MTRLTFNNYSRYVRSSRDNKIFAWCVFLEGDRDLIDSIQMIRYVLHPTFPKPIREITDHDHCFALQSEGWGSFNIEIQVLFENGQFEETEYQLKLEYDDWPKGPEIQAFDNELQRQVYDSLLDPKWPWRKITTIADAAYQPTEVVSRVLELLSEDGFARKSYFRLIDNEELWGATCIVGALPIPK
jgi:hypothetical protein